MYSLASRGLPASCGVFQSGQLLWLSELPWPCKEPGIPLIWLRPHRMSNCEISIAAALCFFSGCTLAQCKCLYLYKSSRAARAFSSLSRSNALCIGWNSAAALGLFGCLSGCFFSANCLYACQQPETMMTFDQMYPCVLREIV